MPKLDTPSSDQTADSAPLSPLEQELATRERFLATLENGTEGFRVHSEIVANLKRSLTTT
jgi:hypothetical protein